MTPDHRTTFELEVRGQGVGSRDSALELIESANGSNALRETLAEGQADGVDEMDAPIDKMAVAGDVFYICAPAPLQHGVEAGLSLPDEYYTRMEAAYRAKRDLLADTLRAVGFKPFLPAGSYYMLAELPPGRYADATDATETILEQVGVATVPAPDFYRRPEDGRRQLRFCCYHIRRTERIKSP